MALSLQIVSFDWPWPPYYGGVVDVYYRIDTLLEMGVHVHLTVISQHSMPGAIPEKWQTANFKLSSFQRKKWSSLLSFKPYIVASRDINALAKHLANSHKIILFEGTHCTASIADPLLKDHIKWVRVHNIEAEYYQELANTTPAKLAKIYYQEEAKRLRKYEPKALSKADLLLCASNRDVANCEEYAPGRVMTLRSSTSLQQITIKEGLGTYALFHAGLHVHDNSESALKLAAIMGQRPDYKFVVAGKDPSDLLKTTLSKYPNVELIANPDVQKMHELIANAQIITLHANHQAGYKVKLLESLARGRWVMANSKMVHGAPNLAKGVAVCDTETAWLQKIDQLWSKPFVNKEIDAREKLLKGYLSLDLGEIFSKKLKEFTFTKN